MKKILIISYFFPPGNFAGSYRIKAWAEHLHKFGYYPVIVTRHWTENETDFTAISEQKDTTKEENDKYTVYRLPYKGSLRDRLVKRCGYNARVIGKVLSFFQVIGQNYFLSSVPYRNLYDFSRQYLKENPGVNIVLEFMGLENWQMPFITEHQKNDQKIKFSVMDCLFNIRAMKKRVVKKNIVILVLILP